MAHGTLAARVTVKLALIMTPVLVHITLLTKCHDPSGDSFQRALQGLLQKGSVRRVPFTGALWGFLSKGSVRVPSRVPSRVLRPDLPKSLYLRNIPQITERSLRRFKVHSLIKGFWDSKKALGLGFIRALRL